MDEINTYLEALSGCLIVEPTKTDKIDVSVAYIQSKLWGLFQERLSKVEIFGSYDRNTFILQDPDVDVDIMVLFKAGQFQPGTYLNQIRAFCEKHYPRSEVYPDHPTIVIEMDHIKFELVPAIPDSSAIKIPAPHQHEFKWISSNPAAFKNRLSGKDKDHKGLIMPLVRILKYWNSINGKAFLSYELERFIVSRDYTGRTLRDYYFTAADGMSGLATTIGQKKAFLTLQENNRRIRALERVKIPEYILPELEIFLPKPK